jgi:hypothetical protein
VAFLRLPYIVLSRQVQLGMLRPESPLVKRLPEFKRGKAGFGFKQLGEGSRVFKAQLIGYFAHRKGSSGELFLCHIYKPFMYMLLRALAGEYFNKLLR